LSWTFTIAAIFFFLGAILVPYLSSTFSWKGF
jgi:hypothetical protein